MQERLTLITRHMLTIMIIVLIACAIGLLAGPNDTGVNHGTAATRCIAACRESSIGQPETRQNSNGEAPTWKRLRLPVVALAVVQRAAQRALSVVVILVPLRDRRPCRARAPLAPPTTIPTGHARAERNAPPTITPAPSATEEPTEAPIFAPAPTPCDQLTAPYQVKQQVFPIGSVVGVSCESADEAQANADSLAATMIADATAHRPSR